MLVMKLVVCTLLVWLVAVACLYSAFVQKGWVRKGKRLIVALVCICIGIYLLFFTAFIHYSFQPFASEKVVAHVSVDWLGPGEFELTYTPAGDPAALAQSIQLRGDQWIITGGIVKWHPLLAFFGIRKSYHKPMRLGGQFSGIKRHRSELPSIHNLSPDVDRFWKALYRADPYLPFIDVVYASSAFILVEPYRIGEIYVGPSGYFMKWQGSSISPQ